MRRAERAALWPLLRSIRVRMVVAFGLLFAMVLAAVGWMGLQGVPFTSLGGRAGRETAEAFRSLNLIADLKKEDLMRWLKERRDDTHILAESPFVADEVAQLRQAIRELAAAGNSDTEIRRRASGEKSYSDLVDLLNDVRDVYGVYGAIQVTDAETGRLLVSTEGGDRRHEAPGISDFAALADSDNSIVGDAEIGPGGQPLFRVYHGIRDRAGEIIAVLMMEVGFDRVVRSMLIAREGLGATGEVLLVNRDARILTSLKHELADGSAARLLEYQIRAKPAKLAAAGEEGIIEAVDYRGERVLAAYRHIRMAPEFGWGLVVKRDESDLLAALREDMLSTAAIAAAAILVVIVLTGLFARRLTAPILALSRAADRVAGGDLTARAPVSTPDEVGVLARTFNSMVGRIQGWHAELEAQVADRTADLRAQIAERERAEEATRGAQQKLIEQQRSETQRIQAELDKARAQLVSQTRLAAIGQLAGGIAHELRNPLGAARNAVFYLKRYLSRPEPDLLQHLGIIDQEIDAANRIISNLLDMARSRPPRKQAVSLAELIREVFEQLQLEEGIQWRVSLAPKSCTVEVDPSQLRQVLVNLVTNAAQSLAGGGGEIEVGGRCAGDFCEIIVRDNGPGVAAEDRDRVFDALFTTKAKGTGMGLAICRDIVEQHDGSIELLESEGSGAAFRIRVPIWHEQER